jgi:HD superfamily phosphohydrolase
MEPAAEIRDPVHGYIYATDTEKELIDTAVFQRLRKIRQLAGAHLVYPGAQHSRFEHVIGAMYLCGLVSKSFHDKGLISRETASELRVAALLHDIGHGPFSHMFEELMEAKTKYNHEDMTQRVIKETEIADILKRNGFSSKEISLMSCGQSKAKESYLNDVISGGLSVDVMDYLLRDSYFTGVEYGKVDVHRLINSLEVVGGRIAIDSAAIYAFEALLIARYEMFRAVYFHRTVRAAELMIVRSMMLADELLNLSDLEDLTRFLQLTDEITLNRIATLEPRGNKKLKDAKQLALDYNRRKLLKCVFEKTVLRKDPFLERIFGQKRMREELAIEIANKANVSPESIYVDVPTTPSVPYNSSSREVLTEVTLVYPAQGGTRKETRRIEDFPLISAISGFMNLIRVYTFPEYKTLVGKATSTVLGEDIFLAESPKKEGRRKGTGKVFKVE